MKKQKIKLLKLTKETFSNQLDYLHSIKGGIVAETPENPIVITDTMGL